MVSAANAKRQCEVPMIDTREELDATKRVMECLMRQQNKSRWKEEPEARNFRWIFLGCPGVGKGTYAGRLSTLLGIPHIATGGLVREERTQSKPSANELESIMNEGKLVPDDIILNLLARCFKKGAVKGETGFILDGFPRTISQAVTLEKVTDIDLVVNLKLREEALLHKCLGRRICGQCGGNFNVASVNVEEQGGQPAIYSTIYLCCFD